MTDAARRTIGPDVAGAAAHARGRLASELPGWLTYHSLEHTENAVVPAARWLAEQEGLDQQSSDLLITAAWFHDVGFIERYERNEQIAAKIVREVLPGYGFDDDDIEVIVGLICATQMPQRPTTPLQEVMCDADLFMLGTDRFFDDELALRAELAHVGRVHTDSEWDEGQIEFLTAHRYFTASARRANDAAKAANVDAVRQRLAAAAG